MLPALIPLAMVVAVPVWQERISPVLDEATRLMIYRIRDGRAEPQEQMLVEAHGHAEFVRRLGELGVRVILCAAVSELLFRALDRAGMKVHPHVCGDVETVLRAFCDRRLHSQQFRMPGCRGGRRHARCRQMRRKSAEFTNQMKEPKT
jgi:predicted Fe-Mo cluster-binding NifX family protein